MLSRHPSFRTRRSYSTRWEEGFSHLKHFSDQERHCRVPQTYKTEDGYRLGQWVKVQRTNKTECTPIVANASTRFPVGSGLQFQLNGRRVRWSQTFLGANGALPSARSYETAEGFRLGDWVVAQRRNKDFMQPDRRRRLEALPGWNWDPFFVRWEENFSRLKQFLQREGHCRVTRSYQTEDGYELGVWVSNQRSRKNSMDADRRQRLQQLPGWSWNPHSSRRDRRAGERGGR